MFLIYLYFFSFPRVHASIKTFQCSAKMDAGGIQDFFEEDSASEDDGFEDTQPGGLRPNYKIPILLVEQREEVLDELLQTESNFFSCATCKFRFTDFTTLETHVEKCSGEPTDNPTDFVSSRCPKKTLELMLQELSQYHSNSLILALKHLFKAGTSGLSTERTDTRLPFYMEPFAGANGEHHSRIVGHLAVVTCRMCKCQYTYRSSEASRGLAPAGFLTNEDQEVDPSLIKHHVKLCPEYEKCHEQFLVSVGDQGIGLTAVACLAVAY